MNDIKNGEADNGKNGEREQEASLVLASELLPTHLPIMTIRPRPLFPGLPVPLEVGVEQAPVVQHAVEYSSKTIGVVLVRYPDGSDEPENLFSV
ncbi:MAG: endopeptidase La, partial [Dehalococcoidia bacterium]